ncbi:MAG: hypothetical protein AB9M53_06970 [Leptothrix sp. (in: b-proteobacteria)]
MKNVALLRQLADCGGTALTGLLLAAQLSASLRHAALERAICLACAFPYLMPCMPAYAAYATFLLNLGGGHA